MRMMGLPRGWSWGTRALILIGRGGEGLKESFFFFFLEKKGRLTQQRKGHR